MQWVGRVRPGTNLSVSSGKVVTPAVVGAIIDLGYCGHSARPRLWRTMPSRDLLTQASTSAGFRCQQTPADGQASPPVGLRGDRILHAPRDRRTDAATTPSGRCSASDNLYPERCSPRRAASSWWCGTSAASGLLPARSRAARATTVRRARRAPQRHPTSALGASEHRVDRPGPQSGKYLSPDRVAMVANEDQFE